MTESISAGLNPTPLPIVGVCACVSTTCPVGSAENCVLAPIVIAPGPATSIRPLANCALPFALTVNGAVPLGLIVTLQPE